MIVPLAAMQKEARKKGYAVPHFLGANFEMTLAAIEAAKECGSPLALGFAPEVFAMIPLEYAVPMLREAADRATVPVSIQLEHGTGYEILARAISLGMQSVMFDGSHLPVEENIQKTKEIVKWHMLLVAMWRLSWAMWEVPLFVILRAKRVGKQILTLCLSLFNKVRWIPLLFPSVMFMEGIGEKQN